MKVLDIPKLEYTSISKIMELLNSVLKIFYLLLACNLQLQDVQIKAV